MRHTCLPISEIRGEKVDRESGPLFVSPMIGYRPNHVRVSGSFLGECAPLHIAHHSTAAIFFQAAEFAASNQRWLRRARVTPFRSHHVGKIQASCSDPYQTLTWFCD